MKDIVLRYFTSHLKNVLENSRRLAVAKKKEQKPVEVADMLKAMALEEGSVSQIILKALKTFQFLSENKLTNSASKVKKLAENPILFSPKAHNVLIGAIRVAQEFRFPYVGTEHLLFAVLENADKETIALLGNDQAELKHLREQLKKVIAKTEELKNEPFIFVEKETNQVTKDFQGAVEPKNINGTDNQGDDGDKQEIIQEMMGEMSDLINSLLREKRGKQNNLPPNGYFYSPRPSFGIMMPKAAERQEKFLEYFGKNLNEETIQGKIDPVLGREKEIDELVRILMRKTKNNPVLVGEPGVGKTAVVAGLARKIVEKEVPPILLGKRIVSLDLGLLVAGTSFRGEFEDRFKRVLDEAENDPNIIIFIDELHNLIGAGSAQGSLDAANIIKPALARGLLRCIGATTLEEYHRYIEKDGALERRFQPVWVTEPTPKETEKILKGIRRFYEEHHNVKIADKAIKEAVKLANRYINDRFLPDKAIDLLDESAAFVVQDEHRQGTARKLQKLEMQREKIHRIKEKMVENNKMEMAASLLKSEKELLELIKEVEMRVAQERQFIPVVDEKDVAEVLSQKMTLPLELVMESTTKRLHNLAGLLKRSLKGQNKVIEEVAATLKRSLVGVADPERPATAFLFVGPTGVGKTYLAKLLAKKLFLKDDSLIRVDMSEFGEKHNVSRLLGPPPGYVGYGDRNSFADRIRKNPYSLILFDEIEKAHPEVFHILLQVLEDGFLTDGAGRKINFRNCIIIFTSNLGNDEFLKKMMGFSEGEDQKKPNWREKKGIRKKLEDFLRPEFLNRLSNVIFFNPLGLSEMQEIAVLEISRLGKRLFQAKSIKLNVQKELIRKIAQKSVNRKEGVRMLRRFVQREIEEPVAQGILAGKIYKGATVNFVLREERNTLKSGRSRFKMNVILPPEPKIYQNRKTEPVFASPQVGLKNK